MKKVQITTLCYKHLRKENQTCPKETDTISTKERSNNIQVPDLISLESPEKLAMVPILPIFSC